MVCNETSLFVVILFIYIYLYCVVPTRNTDGGVTKVTRCLFWALLFWIVYTNFIDVGAELFHFEVTPWKRTCGCGCGGGGCGGCGCGGQGMNFQYTGDAERMNAVGCGGCYRTDPSVLLKNHVNEYDILGSTYATTESYSGCGGATTVERYSGCGC